MSVAKIAKDMTALCRKGKFIEAMDKHYSDEIVSIEPAAPGKAKGDRTKGIKAVRRKTEELAANYKVQNVNVGGPFIGDDQFALHFQIDVTPKGSRQRMRVIEMALYTVKRGKIVQAEFYYSPPV